MDTSDYSTTTNRNGFSDELQKAHKKLVQSKSIKFMDQDEIKTFDKRKKIGKK